jgi:hypothetical protein
MALSSVSDATASSSRVLGAREEKVKGSHIILVNEWVDQHLGAGTFTRLTKNCWGVIVPVGWYDVAALLDVFDEASRLTGKPVEEIATEIARLNAEKDLTSIYRLFLRIAQTQRVLSYTPRLWRTYVSFADARVLKNEAGMYIGEGYGFTGKQIDWACGCWYGFIPTAIRLAGGKEIRPSIEREWHERSQTFSLKLFVKYAP